MPPALGEGRAARRATSRAEQHAGDRVEQTDHSHGGGAEPGEAGDQAQVGDRGRDQAGEREAGQGRAIEGRRGALGQCRRRRSARSADQQLPGGDREQRCAVTPAPRQHGAGRRQRSAATEASDPGREIRPLAPPTSRDADDAGHAPRAPRPVGRSATSSHAKPAMASGAEGHHRRGDAGGKQLGSDVHEEEEGPARSRLPSTAERHHQTPRGSVRATARRTSPAGRARSAEPQRGASAGGSCRVTT